MADKILCKFFNTCPEPVQGRIISFFSKERTRDEALAFFGHGRDAPETIEALVGDHTLICRDERFVSAQGSVQVSERYRIRKDMQLRGTSPPKVPKKSEPVEARTVYAILRTIGTFGKGAKIDADDVRFAAKCDGVNLDGMDPRQLTEVLKQRCTPSTDPEAHRTKWIRAW